MNWRTFFRVHALLLLLVLSLTACGGTGGTDGTAGPGEAAGAGETADIGSVSGETEGAAEEATLSSLLGEDYQAYIIKTVTMQMGNRMDKNPEVVYFPIQEDRDLTDYVAIDETTEFAEGENGRVDIIFPAGTVTDEANGQQTFTVPKP